LRAEDATEEIQPPMNADQNGNFSYRRLSAFIGG
jgi:hypothetical protein